MRVVTIKKKGTWVSISSSFSVEVKVFDLFNAKLAINPSLLRVAKPVCYM